jgi:hypothetical protein
MAQPQGPRTPPVRPTPGGRRARISPDRPPRCTLGRQPHLSEQAGEGRELSGAGDHRQARRRARSGAGWAASENACTPSVPHSRSDASRLKASSKSTVLPRSINRGQKWRPR